MGITLNDRNLCQLVITFENKTLQCSAALVFIGIDKTEGFAALGMSQLFHEKIQFYPHFIVFQYENQFISITVKKK